MHPPLTPPCLTLGRVVGLSSCQAVSSGMALTPGTACIRGRRAQSSLSPGACSQPSPPCLPPCVFLHLGAGESHGPQGPKARMRMRGWYGVSSAPPLSRDLGTAERKGLRERWEGEGASRTAGQQDSRTAGRSSQGCASHRPGSSFLSLRGPLQDEGFLRVSLGTGTEGRGPGCLPCLFPVLCSSRSPGAWTRAKAE